MSSIKVQSQVALVTQMLSRGSWSAADIERVVTALSPTQRKRLVIALTGLAAKGILPPPSGMAPPAKVS